MSIQPDDEAMGSDVFRQLHRARRARRAGAVAVVAGLVVVAGGAVFAVSQFAPAAPPGGGAVVDSAPVAASAALTAANFVSTLQANHEPLTSVHFRLAMESNGRVVNAEGDIASGATPEESAVSMTMSSSELQTFSVVLVSGSAYMNLGEPTQNKFMQFPIDDPTTPFADLLDETTQYIEPEDMFADVDGSIQSVEVSGATEVMDGVEVTPYRVVLDTSMILVPVIPGEVASAVELPPEAEYHYWVGSDGLLRKSLVDLGGIRVETTYERWGQPVSITAPTPEQIMTVPAAS